MYINGGKCYKTREFGRVGIDSAGGDIHDQESVAAIVSDCAVLCSPAHCLLTHRRKMNALRRRTIELAAVATFARP